MTQMKMKTGLLALGMFTIAGAVTISCGGSSDDGNSNTGTTAGTSSTAGKGTGGSTAGTNNSGGGTTATAGTGTGTAGTSNPGGGNTATGGTNNNNNGGADNGQAGDNGNPGAAGAGPNGCPGTQPMDGDACMRGDGGFLGCDYGDQNCRCQRGNGQNAMRTWQCGDAMGAGGAGPGGLPQGECDANTMTGDDCTTPGQCPGQQGCFCTQQHMVFCVQ
jgi:hypothetical protein